jgi:hypothetical protein
MNVEQLREQRNGIVKKYMKLKQPLRDKREQGEGLNKTDWELWDLIDEMMNEDLAPIDHELFLLGAV